MNPRHHVQQTTIDEDLKRRLAECSTVMALDGCMSKLRHCRICSRRMYLHPVYVETSAPDRSIYIVQYQGLLSRDIAFFATLESGQ
jgi:hypothetical protein